MFSGEDSIRIKSKLSEEELEAIIEDALDRLGRVRFGNRGSFTVNGKKFENAFAKTQITGDLSKGRKDGEWELSVNYTVSPTPLLWVLAAVLFLFIFIVGGAIILLPLTTKSDVQQAVKKALRNARDDAEEESESKSTAT
jgi:hypothetical protein